MARLISPRCCCTRGKFAALHASASIIIRLKELKAVRIKHGSEVELMVRGVNGVAHASEDFFFKVMEEPAVTHEGSSGSENTASGGDTGGITVNPLGGSITRPG